MKKDSNNASFVYSVNLLRMLLGMELITKEEYNKIVAISKDHYGIKFFPFDQKNFRFSLDVSELLWYLFVLPKGKTAGKSAERSRAQ